MVFVFCQILTLECFMLNEESWYWLTFLFLTDTDQGPWYEKIKLLDQLLVLIILCTGWIRLIDRSTKFDIALSSLSYFWKYFCMECSPKGFWSNGITIFSITYLTWRLSNRQTKPHIRVSIPRNPMVGFEGLWVHNNFWNFFGPKLSFENYLKICF